MNTFIPEPEILSRRDTEHGRWDVESCRPVRGEPSTDPVSRVMRAPADESERSRVIRAHEMMHAKVSPADDNPAWVQRGIASIGALTAVEELRVNFLCSKAGFDVKTHLTDGGETADGERVAAMNDWVNALHFAIATAGTAASKPFLNGVRRHNRLWGNVLLDICKRALKEMERSWRTGSLSSTEVHVKSGLSPLGFAHTERIAEWIDRLGKQSPPEPEATDGEDDGEDGDGENETRAHSNKNLKPATDEQFGKRLKGITPSDPTNVTPYWGELVIGELPLTVPLMGALGKKKTASNMGRSPRRFHRYVTDPQKRIFDKKVRSSGGIVIIDASGSMSFTREQIKEIMLNAPGCTILSYSETSGNVNAYILADKGKLSDDLPRQGSGNGVDLPAIQWAVQRRKSSTTPIVWVTDGGVCGPGQNYTVTQAIQCINYCKAHNIKVVPHVEEAVKMLRGMRAGRKMPSVWPIMFRTAYREAMSETLS